MAECSYGKKTKTNQNPTNPQWFQIAIVQESSSFCPLLLKDRNKITKVNSCCLFLTASSKAHINPILFIFNYPFDY